MNPKHQFTRMLPLALAAAAASTLTAAEISSISGTLATPTPVRAQAMAEFQGVNTGTRFAAAPDGRIGRVYGRAFSFGDTAEQSTQAFIDQHTDMWGVDPVNLLPEGPFADRRHTLPIGYLPETDSYKFTGTYFTQMEGGFPIFRSKLVLLTRNEPGNPLVLATAQLHDLSNFQVDPQLAARPIDEQRITRSAKAAFADNTFISKAPERFVFAGTDENPHEPTLADISEITVNGFEKYLIVTDVATGEVIYRESLIHTIDITGNASALASEGEAADFCAEEVPQGLPYLEVGVNGGNSVFTDVNGDFTIPHAGVTPVTVSGTLDGRWFDVIDVSASSVETQSQSVTPPRARQSPLQRRQQQPVQPGAGQLLHRGKPRA